MDKPDALRLADELDANRTWLAVHNIHSQSIAEAAAELRRLHAEIAGLKDAVRSARADEAHCWASRVDGLTAQLRRLHAQRDALLGALKACLDWMEALRACGDAGNWEWEDDEYTKGRAAIKAAEEKA